MMREPAMGERVEKTALVAVEHPTIIFSSLNRWEQAVVQCLVVASSS